MEMPSPPKCPQCGAEVKTVALGGLCPACVARMGFGGDDLDGEASTVTEAQGVASADEPPAGIPDRIRRLGDCEVISEIAQGGMGVVYRARQTTLDREVAVKMILTGQLASEIDVKRFRAEAAAAARLDHPNIVAVHEVGVHEGCHYFTMQLIEGGSLAERIPEFSKDSKAAARLIAKVARAIHFAHQHGVIHRDIKPGNILLDENGEPHVTDFGLARLVDRETRLTITGNVVGSPAYMAPEQAHGAGKNFTAATDIYGLGAVLYHLLTGSVPFTGESPIDVLVKLVETNPEPPSKLNAGVDADLEAICLKCLEKAPDARYASADQLAEDLERWLRNEPIQARPATPWARLKKWRLG